MLPLLTSEQMRALDANAIQTIGIPGVVLMENAALAVLREIENRYDDVEDVVIAVLCGPGNNGGDGFAVARQLFLRGADVDVYLLSDPAKLTGDALINYKLLEPLGIEPEFLQELPEDFHLYDYDLIVDALFGTGTVRAPEGVYELVIQAANDSLADIIAIDVPSGVDASTGNVPGIAIEADATVTFQFAKAGLLLPPGREYVGDLIVAPISIPDHDEILDAAPFALPEDDDMADLFPPRPRDAHKGDYGSLLVIAGSRGMSGAARMVAYAALRSGVGLVKVACPENIRMEVAMQTPEIMTIGLPETSKGTISAKAIDDLKEQLHWADAVAVGPGLGKDKDTAAFLEKLFKVITIPCVIDADALNLMAEYKLLAALPKDAILTPHPGEFDRLLAASGVDPEADSSSQPSTLIPHPFTIRAIAARDFAKEHKTVVMLKGSPTICFDGYGFGVVNPTGNPGLATAGAGDVLTGIVASLCAQGMESETAAYAAAYIHGRAADIAVLEIGESSLMAGDVIDYLPDAFASWEYDDDDAGECDHESCNCHEDE
jgi:ADP-dependent NAD(P)H-hydrate dehydratase / NAD(P)H-hydrate epimerase